MMDNVLEFLSDEAAFTLQLRSCYIEGAQVIVTLYTNYEPHKLVNEEDRQAVLEIVKRELELETEAMWYFDEEHFGERRPADIPLLPMPEAKVAA